MKFILPALLLLLVSCQDYNSNSNDVERFSKVNLTPSGGKFEAAYYIIQQRCTNCHSSTIHNSWAKYTNQQDWIDKGYVTANDPDNSQLIFRIINHGSTDSNMPLGMGPLPNDEYQALVDWVNDF
jgi:uncharacterized membrane protein